MSKFLLFAHIQHWRVNKLRWILAIILVLIGAFLFSLTIDQMSNIGHIIMRIVGFGSIFVAGFIVRGKKEE
jgi:hypothetical protein